MTAPQPIPGAALAAPAVAVEPQKQKPKTRTRSQTFAYNRLDADGNVHHLPPDAPVLARSPPAISGGGGGGGGGAGGILGMLGLSPKSSTSNSTIIPFSVSAAAAAAESPSSSSSYYSSSSTGEEAPEAVTPPLLDRVNSRSNDKAAGSTLPAIEQLDEDVFDDDFPLNATATGSTTDYRRAPYHIRSASVGRSNLDTHKSRRSSWSPSAAAVADRTTNESSSNNPGDEPAARSASPSTVDKWLKAQEKTAATTTSPTWAWYSQQRDSGFKDGQTGSSAMANPIGLFRRLSVSSAPRRPAPAAPASVTSETSEISDRPGRSLEKSQGSAPRKLSPMGKRMLMGHFHQFS